MAANAAGYTVRDVTVGDVTEDEKKRQKTDDLYSFQGEVDV